MGAKAGKNGKFYAEYMVRGARYHYALAGADTLGQARVLADEDKRRVVEGLTPSHRAVQNNTQPTACMALSEAADKMFEQQWESNNDGAASLRQVRALDALLGHPRLDEVTYDMLFAAKRKLNVGHTTANRYFAALRAVYNRAVKVWGLTLDIPHFPMKSEKRHGVVRTRVVTADEYNDLCDAVALRYTHLAVFLWETGARLSEPLKLTWDAVDLEHGTCTFTATKSGHARTVVLPRNALDVLRFEKERGAASPFDQIKCSQVACRYLNRTLKGTSLEGITWHMFRHTLATRLATRGVLPKALKEFFGWSSLAMVDRYAKLNADAFQSIATLINGSHEQRQDAV